VPQRSAYQRIAGDFVDRQLSALSAAAVASTAARPHVRLEAADDVELEETVQVCCLRF